jgi:RNA recognition motif-containing protein
MSNQPNTTLYINNLNDQVNKDELRSQLYALFTTYGKIIDVIAAKGPKKRGQAFLVFTDLAGATSALRACEGMVFYDKPMVRKIVRRLGRDAHQCFCSTLIMQSQNHTPL